MTGARERRCALQAPAPRTLARAYQSDCWTKALNAAVGAVSAQLRACRDPSSRSSKVRGSFESSPRETASHTAVTGGGPRHWRRCWCRRRHRACALGGGGGWLLQSAAPRACRRARGEIGRPTTHASIWRRARARVRPARRGKKKAPPFAALGCKGVTKPLETSQAGPPAAREGNCWSHSTRCVAAAAARGGLPGRLRKSFEWFHSGTPHSLRAAAPLWYTTLVTCSCGAAARACCCRRRCGGGSLATPAPRDPRGGRLGAARGSRGPRGRGAARGPAAACSSLAPSRGATCVC